ncbi:MAG: ABC transporter ATP-binding protein [Parvibaculaceae bacterium]
MAQGQDVAAGTGGPSHVPAGAVGADARPARLALEEISKSFGSLKANDGVSLAVRQGTVHAVLGENGAGKSTLMNILYGLYQPDSGRILIDGREVGIAGPRAALELGIGMVHQHFMLVGPLSVAENVALGMRGQGLLLPLETHIGKIAELSASFGFDVDPRAEVAKLPIGMQQRVEILKLLYHAADILILDEPTSVLTPTETGPFFEVLNRLKAAGKTIIFITHKLDEVMKISDDVTVMQRGRVIATLRTADTNPRELARLMVGRDVVFEVRRSRHEVGAAVLSLENVSAASDRGLPALDSLSLEVRAGEVFGIAGVDGNGQKELAEVIAGLRPATQGALHLDGENITAASVSDRVHKLSIGYVPEDRHRDGLVLGQPVAQNLMLRSYDRAPFVRWGFFDFGAIRTHAERLAKAFDVRMQGVDQPARLLSGGNQQKLILARELDRGPKMLVVAQPTKGLDVGAIEFVQRQILEQRDRGVAILYISTELEHLMHVADRIGVMFRGRLMGILRSDEATPEKIGLMMAGVEAA